VVAEGIVIPKGTKLICDTAMSEGFDTLRIYINVDPVTLDTQFTRIMDDRALLVIPYWVNANGQPKPTSGGASNSPVEMTCMDCVTWTSFAIITLITLFFVAAATAFFRVIRKRSVAFGLVGFVALLVPAVYFAVAAWRMLFGPNWHGHLLP
jgi:hypothetical protein